MFSFLDFLLETHDPFEEVEHSFDRTQDAVKHYRAERDMYELMAKRMAKKIISNHPKEVVQRAPRGKVRKEYSELAWTKSDSIYWPTNTQNEVLKRQVRQLSRILQAGHKSAAELHTAEHTRDRELDTKATQKLATVNPKLTKTWDATNLPTVGYYGFAYNSNTTAVFRYNTGHNPLSPAYHKRNSSKLDMSGKSTTPYCLHR